METQLKPGRKKIAPDEKKVLLSLYLRAGDIKKIGRAKLSKQLLDYANTIISNQ
jgi:hypothetical protein